MKYRCKVCGWVSEDVATKPEKCPICGKRIKHPYTGEVSMEQIEEDSQTCIWEEVIDDSKSTIGFHPICKNIHPYTLVSENHKYVHYDFFELVNMWDMTLAEKIERTYRYILSIYKDKNLKKEDIKITICGEKITDIALVSSINHVNMNIDMGLDDTGAITFKVD